MFKYLCEYIHSQILEQKQLDILGYNTNLLATMLEHPEMLLN